MRLLLVLAIVSLASILPAVAPIAPQSGPGGSNPIPEPSTLLLVGSGLVSVAITARLRRRKPD